MNQPSCCFEPLKNTWKYPQGSLVPGCPQTKRPHLEAYQGPGEGCCGQSYNSLEYAWTKGGNVTPANSFAKERYSLDFYPKASNYKTISNVWLGH